MIRVTKFRRKVGGYWYVRYWLAGGDELPAEVEIPVAPAGARSVCDQHGVEVVGCVNALLDRVERVLEATVLVGITHVAVSRSRIGRRVVVHVDRVGVGCGNAKREGSLPAGRRNGR